MALGGLLTCGSYHAHAFDLLGTLKGMAPKEVREVLDGRPAAPSKSDPDDMPGVSSATGLVGAIGLGVCMNNKNAKGADRRALCVLGATLAAEATRQLGNRIADGLREEEQRQVLVAAAESLKTGEPQVVELPDSSTSVDVAPVGKVSIVETKFDLLIDSAAIREVPLIHVMGQTQEVRGAQKLYSSPGSTSATVGSLRSGEVVHAIGRADSSEMVLVSRWVNGADGMLMPMGTGYVNAASLKPSGNKGYPSDNDVAKTAKQTKTVTVTAMMRCQQLAFKKQDSQGQQVDDVSYLCVAPDGQTRSG